MKTLEEMLKDIEHWDRTFDRLMAKSNLSKQDKYELSNIYVLTRDEIVDSIIDGTYEWSIPRKVRLKKSGTNRFRIVYIYDIRDRLVLGALYSILSEYFNDKISDLCYSYKRGVSTQKALTAIKNNKTDEYKYGVKVDIHAYFNSISEDRLHSMVDEISYH